MTSELSSMYAVIGDNLVGSTQSPIHGAAVNGCDGFTARAHANAFLRRIKESAGLFGGSYAMYAGLLVLSGSLNTSHATTRRSLANRPTTPCTYPRSRS